MVLYAKTIRWADCDDTVSSVRSTMSDTHVNIGQEPATVESPTARTIRLIRDAERERCALIAENFARQSGSVNAREIAAIIRKE